MMVLCNVLVLIIYNKSEMKDPMSWKTQVFFFCLSKFCCRQKPRENEVSPINKDDRKIKEDQQESPETPKAVQPQKHRVCWKSAARQLDILFFIVYAVTLLTFCLIFANMFVHTASTTISCNSAA